MGALRGGGGTWLSPLPMYVYDPVSVAIMAANTAAQRHYGYAAAEFVTLSLKDLLAPNHVAALIDGLVVEREWPWHVGIFEHRRKDGTPVWVDIFTHELVMGGRRVRLSVVRDVTKERELEEQLRQAQKMDAWANSPAAWRTTSTTF